MRNIRIVIEYDGSGFQGFCSQPGQRTIEAEIKKAIKAVTAETPKLEVAGRTDAGVHALGQVANFRTRSSVPVARFPFALMKHLPRDIVVKAAKELDLDFSSRRSAKARIYSYVIVNGSFVPVRARRHTWHIRGKLDINRMKEAAKYLIGTHNFKSFCKEESYNKTFLRRIYYIKFALNKLPYARRLKLIEIKIKANAFLHNMVRTIVGTLTDVGRGKIAPSKIKWMLKRRDRKCAGITAPAQGLTLLKVEY